MSLLHENEASEASAAEAPHAPRHRALDSTRTTPDKLADHQHDEIDLTRHDADHAPRHVRDDRPEHGPVQIDPSGRIDWRGMRIRRVRLLSVAKLSFIFWALAFAVLLGTTVVVWSAARAFGFITDIEESVVSALGIDAFQIDGGALFGIAAAVIAFLTVLGWVMTILLAAVYNASCAVFGGLAVETGPLKRRKRVFSLRHGGFVTIRS
jgi:Transmembrane domain of unknown function (DUF3566)